MTDTQNSYKDEYTILSGTNKEAVFIKDNQQISCEGKNALIVSLGNNVSIDDNEFSGTENSENSLFVSTGKNALINGGINTCIFSSGDESSIDFTFYKMKNDGSGLTNDSDSSMGKTVAIATGNNVEISAPEVADLSITLATGNENNLITGKNNACIIAGDNNIFRSELIDNKMLFNLGNNSNITAEYGTFVNFGDNAKFMALEESIILTKFDAVIEVNIHQEDAESVIITTWLEGDDEYAHRRVSTYHYGIDFFNNKTYKVGKKGELIDITLSNQ
ncbi:hypothetical protein OSB94_04605 [Proteus vulgaris]|uniref:hypothetical protein n=1 Tax=Proteus TaxID=583 RepID=UPI000D68E004|nr:MULTISPECIES: hypothetical protein [Proteus]MBQ0215343.1 hypothetical protein [Proteus vulgaris]MDS0787373.1 hypothetical protein [Proteus vulgaris]